MVDVSLATTHPHTQPLLCDWLPRRFNPPHSKHSVHIHFPVDIQSRRFYVAVSQLSTACRLLCKQVLCDHRHRHTHNSASHTDMNETRDYTSYKRFLAVNTDTSNRGGCLVKSLTVQERCRGQSALNY